MTKQKPLLNEMYNKYIKQALKLIKAVHPSDYAFGNLFGDNWRIAIPFPRDFNNMTNRQLCLSKSQDLINVCKMKKMAEITGWKLDFLEGVARKTEKQTNPKTGETIDRLLELKISKWIGRVGSELKEDLTVILNWWNQYASTAGAVVISRHPIDILRMSDFKNLQSCHSHRGGYFECVLEEMQGHGAIAWLISSKDYVAVKDRLQEDEIFVDAHRGVEGINPIARVRLREFHNDVGEYSILVPEHRVYGIGDPVRIDQGRKETPQGRLLASVSGWLKNNQDVHLPEKLKPEEFRHVGGEYHDTSYDKMLSKQYSTRLQSTDEYMGWKAMKKSDVAALEKVCKRINAQLNREKYSVVGLYLYVTDNPSIVLRSTDDASYRRVPPKISPDKKYAYLRLDTKTCQWTPRKEDFVPTRFQLQTGLLNMQLEVSGYTNLYGRSYTVRTRIRQDIESGTFGALFKRTLFDVDIMIGDVDDFKRVLDNLKDTLTINARELFEKELQKVKTSENNA